MTSRLATASARTGAEPRRQPSSPIEARLSTTRATTATSPTAPSRKRQTAGGAKRFAQSAPVASAIGCGIERQTRIAAAGRTAASAAGRSPRNRRNRYRTRIPTNTNGAAVRTTAPSPTAATSAIAGSRDASGAPDQPSIRLTSRNRPPPRALPCSAARLRRTDVAGHNKTPEGTAALRCVPHVRYKYRTCCRCEHRPVRLGGSGPLRARRRLRAGARVGEAPYPRDSENVGRSGRSRPQPVHGGLARRRARAVGDVLAARSEQLVEDLAEGIDDEREVAVVVVQVSTRG